MIHTLEPSEYPIARPLLDGIDHLLLATAVVEGTAPGWVAVDSRTAPRTLFASGPEGHYLVGDDSSAAFNQTLASFLTGQLISRARQAGWAVFNLHYHPDRWEPVLDAIFRDTVVVKNYQRFFKFRRRRLDWREQLPPGFALRRVDAGLLADTHLANLDWSRDGAEGNFGSIERFFHSGFGFCLVHDGEVACSCLADCVSGNRCEIGIRTEAKYRRQGLATVTTAATVDHCLTNGLTEIGWHCWSQNLASAATAEKVGFEEVLHHHAVHIWLNPLDGLLVNGNLAPMQGRHREAAEFYERALAMRQAAAAEDSGTCLLDWRTDETIYLYHAACAWALAGDSQAALKNLERALGKGSFRQAGF